MNNHTMTHQYKKAQLRKQMLMRLAKGLDVAVFAIMLALFIGMCGYHFLGKLNWVDAFLNASMILSGMGPVNNLTATSAKIFAGCYALFSGLLFIMIIGVIFMPVLHYLLQRFKLEDQNEAEKN